MGETMNIIIFRAQVGARAVRREAKRRGPVAPGV